MVWYLASARRGVYRMSITDQGTGLMNRVAYEKCLRKSDQRVIAPAACIYIDANGLHEINNERGHEAGDQLLRAVAERLREQFPRDDLYRVGGDEFVVFPAPAAEAEYEARMRAVSESLAAQGYGILLRHRRLRGGKRAKRAGPRGGREDAREQARLLRRARSQKAEITPRR